MNTRVPPSATRPVVASKVRVGAGSSSRTRSAPMYWPVVTWERALITTPYSRVCGSNWSFPSTVIGMPASVVPGGSTRR